MQVTMTTSMWYLSITSLTKLSLALLVDDDDDDDDDDDGYDDNSDDDDIDVI